MSHAGFTYDAGPRVPCPCTCRAVGRLLCTPGRPSMDASKTVSSRRSRTTAAPALGAPLLGPVLSVHRTSYTSPLPAHRTPLTGTRGTLVGPARRSKSLQVPRCGPRTVERRDLARLFRRRRRLSHRRGPCWTVAAQASQGFSLQGPSRKMAMERSN